MRSERVRYLFSPAAIRERAGTLLARARRGQSAHFLVEEPRLDVVRDYVLAVTTESYPTLDIPVHARWRHFDVGGVRRTALLEAELQGPPRERARAKIDLVVTSVLLDAGAGPAWHYIEPETALELRRSEGLAVASFHLFRSGAFSSDPAAPLRADAEGLQSFSPAALEIGFEVGPHNPLVGAEGRAALMRSIGKATLLHPELFGRDTPRPGGLVDALWERAAPGAEGRRVVDAKTVLECVLIGFGSIFPERLTLDGVPLGDVWAHSALGPAGSFESLVPIHKLSQWLTYSLLEPLTEAGLEVRGVEELTGLAEYRNGGLLLDLGLLALKDPAAATRLHHPSDELVVEWRALTVALLDEIGEAVRRKLGKSQAELPLAKVLEGGTWAAGRKAAAARRSDGGPPLRIDSDGTVF